MTKISHSSHWGAFQARTRRGRLVDIQPHPRDPDPSALLANMRGTRTHRSRIASPMVRRGWLEQGPRADGRRGRDAYVPVTWDEAIELLSAELRRVYGAHGPEAVYGGSYGWASAGRFHHAQSQIHRFLNTLGGYTASHYSYSLGTSQVLVPYVLGLGMMDIAYGLSTQWESLVEHTELVVVFGGLPAKNAQVGGVGIHETQGHLRAMRDRGARFVTISPIRGDTPAYLDAQWIPLRPATDTALMLALAHVLVTEGRHDTEFLARCCTGAGELERYVRGESDGIPKTPAWAAAICDVPESVIVALARDMAGARTLINLSWSLQRAEHGEQPIWMGIALAAMLGGIGRPGEGFGLGYSAVSVYGNPTVAKMPTFPQGKNPCASFIPVARIADMLLEPGGAYTLRGETRRYPDIRLVYWAGGNPFHHHQDLARLTRAFARPETVVVHEHYWTSTAKHADFVLPATMTLERNDIAASSTETLMTAMKRAVSPWGEARSDYDIFAALSRRLGTEQAFTEMRDEAGWLRHMYTTWAEASAQRGVPVPDFDRFWADGEVRLPAPARRQVLLQAFRDDPARHPLATPSGRIELLSSSIAGFDLEDCPGHPAWLPAEEWLGAPLARVFPLQLIANNPATRLHSQLDMGATSKRSKVQGREPARMHPADAHARGIEEGDLVRLFNARGSCLAGAVLTDDLMPGVVQLSTGAWFDPVALPDGSVMCVHGNPNVLTADRPSSSLSQGCAGQLALVQVERFHGEAPALTAWNPPVIVG